MATPEQLPPSADIEPRDLLACRAAQPLCHALEDYFPSGRGVLITWDVLGPRAAEQDAEAVFEDLVLRGVEIDGATLAIALRACLEQVLPVKGGR